MKKSLLIVLVLLTATFLSIKAQWITALHIQPTNPTTADVIYAYADTDFPYGSCDDKIQTHGISGNVISANALHCLGVLAFICSTTDTFVINPLPAGNYSFIFSVDAGGAPSPCTPGIVPGPTDSLQFTVTSTTSISTNSSTQPEIFLNPSTNILNVDLKNEAYSGKEIQLYDILGNKIISRKILDSKFYIDVSSIQDGIYIVKINDAESPFTTRISKR